MPRKVLWTLDSCLADAKKYKHRGDWKVNNSSAYTAARKNGWLGECCQHMAYLQRPSNWWTLERCKKHSLMYNSRNEWKKSHNPSYRAAHKNNWITECCVHMKPKQCRGKGYWSNQDRVFQSAMQYSCQSDWFGVAKNFYNRNHKRSVIKDLKNTGSHEVLAKDVPILLAAKIECNLIKKYHEDDSWNCLNNINNAGMIGSYGKFL